MIPSVIIGEIEVLSCSNSWRNFHFVKITAENGLIGWSEFDEFFGMPHVSSVIESLAPRIIGQNAVHHQAIRQDLLNVTRPGAGGVVGQAIGSIENALIDLYAKSLDVPAYVVLGGKIRDRIRVYWSHFVSHRARVGHFEKDIIDVGGVRENVKDALEGGYTALKTNVFNYDDDGKTKSWAPGFGRPFDPSRNAEKNLRKGLHQHLELLRETSGDDMDIMLDLNFNSRPEGYLSILRELEDLDLFWVELDVLDAKALSMIRSQSKHPIASCETLIGLHQFLPFFDHQSIDVAIVDTLWNGVWQSMHIAAAADAFDVNVACHNFYGHLSTMMNAHFCAAVPNLRIMEIDVDRVSWDRDIFTHLPDITDGYMTVPDRPGWGTEPIEAELKKFPPIPDAGLARAAPRQSFL
ncbi:mandelate racemase/muconate lactonizing enzyme family protein [Sneathiella marina]|uniref:Mandelate racemase/muconate lactonizing enzyme family protein n=1 Tax=Sneathiella marina TaxID=2950108 RepID=A0ABY4W2Z9_9PROT|nr:mandelate racemase/muconate lactonizing enzyme family protein [Sneathiella marina]USG61572.1 mandelate racemase/muconate lactonizing enzyme family protein [Sneathiella marina]